MKYAHHCLSFWELKTVLAAIHSLGGVLIETCTTFGDSNVSSFHLGAKSSAQSAKLTLCRAAWDPANALVEQSTDFERAKQ